MDFARLQPDVIKYEVRRLSGDPIGQARQKKPGGFARFLSGLGRLAGAVMGPLSFVFPPAAIGAAASYGLSQTGDIMQGGAARKMLQQQQDAQGDMGQVYIPGLTQTSMDLTSEQGKVFKPMTVRDQQATQILVARNDLDLATAQQV